MSSIQNTNQFQSSWIIPESKNTADTLLSFIDKVSSLSSLGQFTKPTLNFSGSPIGISLNGELSVVRNDYATIENHTFNSTTFVATFPQQSNLIMTLSINFPQRLLSLVLQNTNAAQSRLIIDDVKSSFPYEMGISEVEYTDKISRISELLKQAEVVTVRVNKTSSMEKAIEKTQDQIKACLDKAIKEFDDTVKIKADIVNSKNEVTKLQQVANQSLSEISNLKTQVQTSQQDVQKRNSDVISMEAKVKDLFTMADEYSQKLKKHDNDIASTIKATEQRTNEIIVQNEKLQAEINEQLLKAVGNSLFGAFHKRKSALAISKWIWASLSILSVLLQGWAVIWLASVAHGIDGSFIAEPMFILKATVTIPLFFLIGFCVSQYAHERKYEESYAFKSALSFSLSPYLDLVKNLPKDDSDAYRDFAVKTIGQVFEEPAHHDNKGEKGDGKMVNLTKDIIESINKLVSLIRQ